MITRQRFLHIVQPTKWRGRFISGALGCKFVKGREKVKKVEPNGVAPVYALTTGTGNYIVWGLASSNSAGQMQQRPAPPEGGLFKRSWFEIWHDADFKPRPTPRDGFERLIRGWDFGYTEKDGDWTVGVLMGMRRGRLWVLDVVRGQWGSGQRDDSMALVASDDFTIYGESVCTWFPQDPAAGKDVAERCASKLKGYRVYYEPVTRDKAARADSYRSFAWAGHRRGELIYIAAAPWTRQYIDELCVFPNGAHDDQVDASSLAFVKVSRPFKSFSVGAG